MIIECLIALHQLRQHPDAEYYQGTIRALEEMLNLEQELNELSEAT